MNSLTFCLTSNTVVILDKKYRVEKKKQLLNDMSQFDRHEIPSKEHLIFLLNSQDKIINTLKNHNNKQCLPDFLY